MGLQLKKMKERDKMNRRSFVKDIGQAGIGGMLMPITIPNFRFSKLDRGETLYNGIVLQKEWPPTGISNANYEPMEVPYLISPPDVIPIDVGRQLFVDDFLIESTDLEREFHNPVKIKDNPIFKAKTDLEYGSNGLPVACPKDGGVWWDDKDQKYKMWYEAGWLESSAYAESKDGIEWQRPIVNVRKGSNQILEQYVSDSNTVWLDHHAKNGKVRFKMFFREPDFRGKNHGYCMVSPDGIEWEQVTETAACGDRSTIFFNPFRKKWIYSIRTYSAIGRARNYSEHSDFLTGADWKGKVVFWTGADRLDLPDPEIGDKPQLYNLSAVAYESLIIGLHQIHLGPANEVCEKTGMPKCTELKLSFTRDGFHWDRPNRRAFIAASRKGDSWDRGYVQSVGGICNVVGDELRFYYTGFRGDPTKLAPDGTRNGMYANGGLGVAVLRRDGFASMNASVSPRLLVSRKITFKGRYLFVNVDCPTGELKVEILNDKNEVIPGFSSKECRSVATNATSQLISWETGDDLKSLVGKTVKFKFRLSDGKLFAFWVSAERSGSSGGYVAAGGPGYKKDIDDIGNGVYRFLKNQRSFI